MWSNILKKEHIEEECFKSDINVDYENIIIYKNMKLINKQFESKYEKFKTFEYKSPKKINILEWLNMEYDDGKTHKDFIINEFYNLLDKLDENIKYKIKGEDNFLNKFIVWIFLNSSKTSYP